MSDEEASHLVDKIYSDMYIKFSSDPLRDVGFNDKFNNELVAKAREHNVIFRPMKQKHIGSEKLPLLFDKLKIYLENRGIKFEFGKKVEDIILKNNECKGVVIGKNSYFSDC